LKDIIFSRAPVRICDIGGWTDTWFYPKGAVLSFSIDLYSKVRIIRNSLGIINIISEDLEISTEIKDYYKIEYNGTLDLLKAAVKRMQIQTGVDIFVRADAPPGCGTGTSASIAVALIAALAKLSEKPLTPIEIADLAHKLEIEELKLESGVQDQYAASLGGINFMKIDYPSVEISKVQVKDEMICKLENQLILVYFGSRSSDLMHKAVIENYKKGDNKTIISFNTIKECAYEMIKAIKSDDLEYMGEIMNRNWEAQKSLHDSMTNLVIDKAEQVAKENGAIGFKLNGAGGGGSATILSRVGYNYQIKKNLIENGFKLLPVKLNFKGVQTW
jgi:D-glycero-alpha-D-manno-heptose-7-phosphate kinase